jgi:hypothetical protein
LNKRRAKMTFPLQKTEELGLDRPTFIWTINLSYRGAAGAGAEPGERVRHDPGTLASDGGGRAWRGPGGRA